ncbi:MAG: hypothetical protein AB7V08_08920 [Elusimicrobiales bacterium]
MTLDFADFTRASNLSHLAQGAALLLLGAAEAWALDNKNRRFIIAAAAALALSGVVMFLAVLGLPGGWSLAQLGEALTLRRGFYLFLAFAFVYAAAGFSLLTHEAVERRGSGWQVIFLALLAFAGVLYFVLAWRVNPEAWREVLVWHSAIGATLLLAVGAKTASLFVPRRALGLAWAVLLMITGLQLVSYRESEETFAPKLVTIEAAPAAPPAGALNNAKPADKKRTAN